MSDIALFESQNVKPVITSNVPIITIDGPSGSGKGTLASKIAEYYQFHLLDSGALYRLLALAVTQYYTLNPEDILYSFKERSIENIQIAQLALTLNIEFAKPSHTEQHGSLIFLNHIDVTQMIRQEPIGILASALAALPEVRVALLTKQLNFAQPPGLVADGRDMGTVVFPHAPAKLFLTASLKARAERRLKQLQQLGLDGNISHILSDLAARDMRDTQRVVAPLLPAFDAHVIDCSNLSIEAVFAQMLEFIDSRLHLA